MSDGVPAPARPAPSPVPAPPVPAPAVIPAPAPEATRGMAPAAVALEAAPQQPASDTGIPSSAVAQLAEGGFLGRIGSGLILTAEDLAARGVDLSQRPQPLPGVVLRRADYRDEKVMLTGDLAVPHLARGEFGIKLNRQGQASISGRLTRKLEIPALGNPQVTVTLNDAGAVAGAIEFEQIELAPRALRGLKVEGAGRLEIANGKMFGNGAATLIYESLGSAVVNFRFTEAGDFAADGQVHITPPFLEQIDAALAVDEQQNLTAEATIGLGGQRSPLPGLTVSGGSITVGYSNGRPKGSLAEFAADYSGLATVRIAALALNKSNQLTGAGSFTVTVPMLNPVEGQLQVTHGKVSGSLRISAKDFPESLPVRNGTITVTLSENGQVGFAGTVGVDLGPAGRGNLSASYDQGKFAMGAEVDLTVPGLQTVHVSVAYADGAISGRVDAPVNSDLIPGLDGAVTVRFEENRWSGETTLAYSADDGNLSGTVTVTVAQTEKGTLVLGGSGSVTAQLMPKLSGTLTATILPEGGVDVSGAIEVSEPLELFPEKRVDTELFSHSQNIPLWAILVAVIRVRAGVRAGIGPGVFRNIRVEGSYTIGSAKADPSFSVSGEVYIPAFVEGYVAFGAGLGLDVVLGSLTGGIEGIGTAGIYGAISVIPELHYADGVWGIEGTATLAAGARLKLALNAWAEVEALWVTVWDNEWKLAEHVMPIGPNLALRARMNYKFGQSEPPEIEFSSSDIDADALIQGAMPEDGPAPSGAREALENRAEWQGALREQRAVPLPADLAAQAHQGESPPPVPAKPPGNKPGPPAAGAQAGGTGPNQDPGAAPTPGNEQARSQAVDNAAKPDSSIPPPLPADKVPTSAIPRYPGPITLAMLDEPAAPMPRTREQENQDLDAARRAVELAAAQASDSDALDNYFPKIKNRFGLASLGYEGDFQHGFHVAGQINPEFKLEAAEPLTGTGIPGDLQTGHITKVDFWTGMLASEQVGIRMVADPLGPDHPMGSEPAGQKSLMDMLTGDYIRGHLLNHNIGGPGEAKNLFPITRSANAVHHQQMEDPIKRWINDKRYWVKYTVEIEARDEIEGPGSPRLGYINSKIKASASVLNTKLAPVTTIATTISSVYEAKATTTSEIDVEEAEKKIPEGLARPIDIKVAVQVPDRGNTPLTFPVSMEITLDHAIAAHSRDWVSERLQTYRGIGKRRAAALLKAYDLVKGASDRTITGLSTDEEASFNWVKNAWEGTTATLG